MSENTPSSPPQDKLEAYLSSLWEQFKKERSFRDLLLYFLLLLALLMLFIEPFYGQLLLGAIFALCFFNELKGVPLVSATSLVKTASAGAVLLLFLFSVPFLFLGVAVVWTLRFLLLIEE